MVFQHPVASYRAIDTERDQNVERFSCITCGTDCLMSRKYVAHGFAILGDGCNGRIAVDAGNPIRVWKQLIDHSSRQSAFKRPVHLAFSPLFRGRGSSGARSTRGISPGRVPSRHKAYGK